MISLESTDGAGIAQREEEYPSEVTVESKSLGTTSSHATPRLIKLRGREPIAYPVPRANTTLLFGFERIPSSFFYPHSSVSIPHSAVFFASRFHYLRELVRRLGTARNDFELYHRIEKDIYSLLLSMLAYFVGEKGLQGGEFDLRFDFTSWANTYRRLSNRGSDIFGVRDGFGTNREFLLKIEVNLSSWFAAAVHWWIPEKSLKASTLR